jgi:hypothetical protein
VPLQRKATKMPFQGMATQGKTRQLPLQSNANAFARQGKCLCKARQVPLQGKARQVPVQGKATGFEKQGKCQCRRGKGL